MKDPTDVTSARYYLRAAAGTASLGTASPPGAPPLSAPRVSYFQASPAEGADRRGAADARGPSRPGLQRRSGTGMIVGRAAAPAEASG